ncbi:hypothetical protein PKF023_08940 [Polynucleobacter yangtzensis]|uniref:Lipoprotein n=1 Tax=Polynucleobacter yangtzensis TaxID=1743159 RepID=A0A9C7CAB2_9BURK|nr:hypothetical protein [Polynucleobacter yangtzensis]BDT77091.1 hypothetical protein PKF023_08940 [Polynucleobacter yangtzensis]BDT78943.1 hypothetical protein PKF032_08310 [Polynucleobacter yangtzensis]
MHRIIYRVVLLLAIGAGLAACNHNDKKISGWEINDVYHSTIITPNSVTGGKTYQGPPINTMDEVNTYEMFSLRAEQTKQGAKTYELVAQLTYFSQWRYYDSAILENTPASTFKVVGREAGACGERGCIFREVLSIQLTEAFLKDRMKKGFIITVSSKSGIKTELYVPPQYIQGYMQAVNGFN